MGFRYKDYRAERPDTQKTMTLAASEFIRRFLLHVLPRGFHRIRYYGLLGHRHRTEKLDRCRQLLGTASPPEPVHHAITDYRDRYEALTGVSLRERQGPGHHGYVVIHTSPHRSSTVRTNAPVSRLGSRVRLPAWLRPFDRSRHGSFPDGTDVDHPSHGATSLPYPSSSHLQATVPSLTSIQSP